jgi:hypothetical protein
MTWLYFLFVQSVFVCVGRPSPWAKKKGAGAGGNGRATEVDQNTAAAAAAAEAAAREAEEAEGDGEEGDAEHPAADVKEEVEEVVPESWDEGGEGAQEGRTVSAKLKPSTAAAGNDDAKMWATDQWAAMRPGRPAPVNGAARGGGKSVAASAEEAERKRQDELANAAAQLLEYSEPTQRSVANVDESLLNYDLIEQLLGSIIRTERTAGETALVAPSSSAVSKGADGGLGAVLIFLPGQGEIRRLIQNCERSRYLEEQDVGRLMFLPLYGALSSNDQRRIFAKPPPGVRKVVVATNIAETSVTIDDVRYVIDTVGGLYKLNAV